MWSRYGVEATAVARSVQCQVPLLPNRSKSDMPSPPKKGKKGRRKGIQSTAPGSGRALSRYHNRRDYWVSPSSDWNETVPQGPGYHTKSVTMSESWSPDCHSEIGFERALCPVAWT